MRVIRHNWKPNPKQLIVYNAKQKYINCLGDPRTGKSEGFFEKLRYLLLKQPGMKALITRDTGTSLLLITMEHIRSKVLEEELIASEDKKPFPVLTLKNGSKLYFIPYDEMDTTKAGGSEYSVILIEEAHRFSLKQYMYMDTRLSQQWGYAINAKKQRVKSSIAYRGLWTTQNPAGRGYLWQIFRKYHPMSYFGQDPTHLGVEFYLVDNKANLNKEYVDSLNAYPQKLKDQFLGALESPMQGLCFPEFDRNLCFYSKTWIPTANMRVIGGMDFGFQTPTVFLWMAITEDAFCVFFKEYRKILTPRKEHSKAILAINDELIQRGCQPPEIGWVDPSTDMQDGKTGSAETVYEQLKKDGLFFLHKAKKVKVKDRVVQMRDLLRPDPSKKRHPITGEFREEGWPTIIFTSDCEETVAEFEEWEFEDLSSDRRDPVEKPQEKNDHGPDAAYYCLNSYYGYGSHESYVISEARENDPVTVTKKIIDKTIKDNLSQRDGGRVNLNQTGLVI